jgi:hypothetical protein
MIRERKQAGKNEKLSARGKSKTHLEEHCAPVRNELSPALDLRVALITV